MSSKNTENNMEQNMIGNADMQGQDVETVNKNHQQNFNVIQQNPEKTTDAENHNLESVPAKGLSQNIQKHCDKSLDPGELLKEHPTNETVKNNSEIDPLIMGSLDNENVLPIKSDITLGIKPEPLGDGQNKLMNCKIDVGIITDNRTDLERNSDPKNIVSLKYESCDNKDENSSNCTDECVNSEEVNKVLLNTESIHNNLDSVKNNLSPECAIESDNSVQPVDDTSEGLEKSTDRSSEMLADKVVKLNISTEEKQSNVENSKVEVKMQSESLKSLMAYDGDSDSEDSNAEHQAEVLMLSSEDEDNNTNTKKTWRKTLDNDSDSTDSECDSSASTLSSIQGSDMENSDDDSGSVIDASYESASVIDAGEGIRGDSPVLNKSNDKGAVKKKNPNILDMEEFLPPLPDLSKLTINVENEEFMHMGRISAIISELVTVTALPGTPAFDLDSMLFIDDQTSKKPIGPIFDVLGPVAEPIYCVRFNSEKEVKDLGLKSGMKVYTAAKSEEFTKYVFLQELMKIKGSDASWLNDHETPSDLAEFSDDEQEREARRAKKSGKRKYDDSLERHQRYERTMNQCNTLNTRVCKLMDTHKNMSKQIRHNKKDYMGPPGCLELPPVPPQFDPTVPPPGFRPSGMYAGYLNRAPSFGEPPNFNSVPSSFSNQGNVMGSHSSLSSPPVLFGHHYANEPPSPQSLCPPPARWNWQHQQESLRPHRKNTRSHPQNSNNFFSYTNNSRNSRGAGPSSQPF